MMKYIVFLVIMCELCLCDDNEMRVIRRISSTIGVQVLACRNEIKFSNEVIQEFLKYWDTSIALDDPNMGCVVMCVLEKLELVQPGGDLKVTNAEAFTTANGSDKITSQALIALYQLCKSITTSVEPCTFALDIARCFRAGVTQLEWAPDPTDTDLNDEF